ncbi:MAG TPA: hypothetical protein VHZ04_01175 [Candidatus Paceibacterota bacterium]|jgi:hypothetical protein|nr:hypothetical protein [Candidatus Paceibacterota bacterium]
MKIRYTLHAERRLLERGITKREVAAAFHFGAKSDIWGGLRKCVYKDLKGTLIVIYHIRGFLDYKIITLYYEH